MLTPDQLAEIEARAAQANDLKGDVLLRAQIVDTDVPALLAEVERLRALLEAAEEDSAKLRALEAAGVDNWDGYSYAMEILNEGEGR